MREVHIIFPDSNDNTTMLTKYMDYRRDNGNRGGFNRNAGRFGTGRGNNRRFGNEKELYHCDHCNMKGHTKDGCFKLIGYPDWFKMPKERGLEVSKTDGLQQIW